MWGQYPPSPYNWLAGADNVLYYRSASLGTNFVLIDDTQVDYAALNMNAAPMDASGPPMPGGGNDGGTNYSGGGFKGPKYGSNDLYLQINLDTNNPGNVDLTLYGATNGYWELLTKTNLFDRQPWSFNEILYDDGTTNTLSYPPVPDVFPPIEFFRAVSGNNVVSISPSPYYYIAIEPDAQGLGAQNGLFTISLQDDNPKDVTVLYRVSGRAVPGADYSNYPGTINSNFIGSVTIPAGNQSQTVTVQPFHDPKIDFDEPAIFTVILTNGYVVDPANFAAPIIIRDNFDSPYGPFSIVGTNVPAPASIDYHAPKQSLLIGVNFEGQTTNFALLNTNNVLSYWSGVQGLQGEVKFTTVKSALGAFTNGDVYFDNDSPGGIGWLSANGNTWNTNWCVLTNETDPVQGSVYIDQTGVWSNSLLAVTSDGPPEYSGTRGVWRIISQTNTVQLARISTTHLEGLLTLSNDQRYGPWAGKLLTGDENEHVIYAINTNGVSVPYFLGIDPDAFKIIPATQNLYCVNYVDNNPAQSRILKIPSAYLTNYVGDILVEQSGEASPNPALFIVQWNGTNAFNIWTINVPTSWGHFEGVTFAPIDLKPV